MAEATIAAMMITKWPKAGFRFLLPTTSLYQHSVYYYYYVPNIIKTKNCSLLPTEELLISEIGSLPKTWKNHFLLLPVALNGTLNPADFLKDYKVMNSCCLVPRTKAMHQQKMGKPTRAPFLHVLPQSPCQHHTVPRRKDSDSWASAHHHLHA